MICKVELLIYLVVAGVKRGDTIALFTVYTSWVNAMSALGIIMHYGYFPYLAIPYLQSFLYILHLLSLLHLLGLIHFRHSNENRSKRRSRLIQVIT